MLSNSRAWPVRFGRRKRGRSGSGGGAHGGSSFRSTMSRCERFCSRYAVAHSAKRSSSVPVGASMPCALRELSESSASREDARWWCATLAHKRGGGAPRGAGDGVRVPWA
eukprot:2389254-Prymnesium_polylepis.1